MITKLYVRIKNSELLLGSFWTIVGSGGARVAMVIGTVITANLLGVVKYGEFGILRGTINLFLTLGGLNIGSVITKYIAEYREKDKLMCSRLITQNYFFVVSLIAVLCFFIYFNASSLSELILGGPGLKNELRLSTFVIFFGIISPLNEAVYRGYGWFKILGLVQVLSSLSFMVLVPLGAYINGIFGAIFGYLIYAIVMLCTTCFYLIRRFYKTGEIFFSFDRKIFELSSLKSLSLPVLLTSLVEAPFFWYSQVLLVKFAGLAENGIVNAVLQMRNLILIIPGYVSLVVLPLLSNALSNSDQKLYKNFYKKSIIINVFLALVCVLPFLMFAKDIMSIFGREFNVEWQVTVFAFLAVPFLVMSSLANQSLIAQGRGWVNFYIALLWNVLFIITIYYLVDIRGLGALGYFLSLLISIIFLTFLKVFYSYRFF